MSAIQLSNDATTLVLNGRVYANLSEGDFVTLNFPNPRTSHVNSVDGGVTINGRVDGPVANLTVRVQKYSDDDIALNNALNQNPTEVLNGSMKTNFTRDGVDGVETYTLENGSLTDQPENTKNNQDGNAVMEYVIRFRSAKRAL